MAQLSDDCFAFGGPMLSLDAATAQMRDRIAPVAGIEIIAPDRADGRVLAADIVAASHVPPFDNSAVDGYAVAFADLAHGAETSMPVSGRWIAGAGAVAPLQPGTSARIFTGARLPPGADTVFMQEDVRTADGQVILPPGLKPGANARHAGEDVRAGDVILKSGRTLLPQDLALAAAAGVPELPVRRPLRVAIFSTGNEIAASGAPLPDGAIHDANRPMLAALLRRAGATVTDLGIQRDDPQPLARALQDAAGAHDLVVTTGGVSTGEEDHVKAAVERVGTLVFWRIGIKPGRPVALGVLHGADDHGAGNDAVFCGLPGNPVAAFVTFVFVVRPLLACLAGAMPPVHHRLPVRSGFSYAKKKDRREYVRVALEAADDGWRAVRHPQDGAGIITSLTATDGLVELPEHVTRVAVGDSLAFLPFSALLA